MRASGRPILTGRYVAKLLSSPLLSLMFLSILFPSMAGGGGGGGGGEKRLLCPAAWCLGRTEPSVQGQLGPISKLWRRRPNNHL